MPNIEEAQTLKERMHSELSQPSKSAKVRQTSESAEERQNTQASRSVYADKLAERYNNALRDDIARREFSRSIDSSRVGVLNSEERIQDPTAAPIFGEESNGDYWVVEEDEADGTALAIPRLGLVISDAQRKTGAMDQVFQCEDPNHGRSYEVARLEEPARLSKERDGSWQLERKGKIQLTRYD